MLGSNYYFYLTQVVNLIIMIHGEGLQGPLIIKM